MQVYMKDENTLVINTMIDDRDKDNLLKFINNMNNLNIIKTPLYNTKGDVSGLMLSLETNSN